MLPTWIFQRGGEHLILNCRENARGVTLIVSGDGDLRSYSFHDFAALVKFESQMAEFLLHSGWSPAQLTIEPRAIPNHHVTRPGTISTAYASARALVSSTHSKILKGFAQKLKVVQPPR